MVAFKRAADPDSDMEAELQRLAKFFKVSTLVILRRYFDAGFISKDELWEAYRVEMSKIRAAEAKQGGGGDFYKTLAVRTGKRFARAVLASAMEGQTMLREAGQLLGFKKVSTLERAARELEVVT
jgi:Zn-dependent peptidase ImmA (M78 family)